MAKEKEVKKKKRPTAEKRIIQNVKKRMQNKVFKTHSRTEMRRFEEALVKGDAEQIKSQLKAVYSVMDLGVKRGIYKLGKASRTKSRMTAKAAAKVG